MGNIHFASATTHAKCNEDAFSLQQPNWFGVTGYTTDLWLIILSRVTYGHVTEVACVLGSQMRPDHWASGEPSGADDRECVILSTDVSTGLESWKTHNCSASLPFLCQFGMPRISLL